jgi:1-deoxy-D-xylulose-5-phosphate reductoisomerase
MGAKITIDSASLMNKGLEVIEAKWLFNLQSHQIDVIVHPQSIVHSLVQFEDGSMKAQMGLPDMKLPIQFALTYPQRLKTDFPRFNFMDYPNLTFEQADRNVFKNLDLAYRVMEMKGTAACALNAANEVAVAAFLENKISFLAISELNQYVVEEMTNILSPKYDDFVRVDLSAREITHQKIERL